MDEIIAKSHLMLKNLTLIAPNLAKGTSGGGCIAKLFFRNEEFTHLDLKQGT